MGNGGLIAPHRARQDAGGKRIQYNPKPQGFPTGLQWQPDKYTNPLPPVRDRPSETIAKGK